MVRYTHPEMFYLFIPLTLVLIWYAYQGRKLRMGLEGLGIPPVKKFLLNRVKHSSIRLRSRLIILGIIFILLASVGPQIGMKLTELTRQGVDIFILMDTSNSSQWFLRNGVSGQLKKFIKFVSAMVFHRLCAE